MIDPERPPRLLHDRQAVCFARLDAGAQPTRKLVHVQGGHELGPFRGLAITQDPSGFFSLLYCDAHWRPLADTWHETLELAKAQAELEYEGVSQAWQSNP